MANRRLRKAELRRRRQRRDQRLKARKREAIMAAAK